MSVGGAYTGAGAGCCDNDEGRSIEAAGECAGSTVLGLACGVPMKGMIARIACCMSSSAVPSSDEGTRAPAGCGIAAMTGLDGSDARNGIAARIALSSMPPVVASREGDGFAGLNGTIAERMCRKSSAPVSASDSGARAIAGSGASVLTAAEGGREGSGAANGRMVASTARRSSSLVPASDGALGAIGKGPFGPRRIGSATVAATPSSTGAASPGLPHVIGWPKSSTPANTLTHGARSGRVSGDRPRHTTEQTNRSASMTSVSAASSIVCAGPIPVDVARCQRARPTAEGNCVCTRGNDG
jgi:hypothetical protein